VDVTNSYAVPFEEDLKDPTVWFLDHNYHEEMYAMFKKVSAKEKVVGWYSTGPKIRPADIEINELIRKYTANPVLAIIDVNPTDELEIPTEAYISVENVPEQQSSSRRTFVRLPSEVGAYEAEEVGVEHLLRNIRDTNVGTVTDQVAAKLNSLKGLRKRTEQMAAYLDAVAKGEMPINHSIIYNLQNMFNLSPDLKVDELVKAFAIKTNDNMLAIYVSSMIRSIIALHNLINNKLANRLLEAEKKAKETEDKEAKEKAEKEKAESKAAADKQAADAKDAKDAKDGAKKDDAPAK
jgi:26S proteasome regulatory subunit N8